MFGYYIEDNNQGGAALGRRVLQAVFDSESGLLPETELTGPVLAFLDCTSVEELLRRQVEKRLAGEKVLRLPQVLEQAALAEEPAALEILRQFGRDIARYPAAGLKRFGLAHSPVDMVLSGSVFKCRARVLQETVIAEIRKAAPNINVIESVYEPIIGAALGALDGLGVSADPAVTARVDRDARRLGLIRKGEEAYAL